VGCALQLWPARPAASQEDPPITPDLLSKVPAGDVDLVATADDQTNTAIAALTALGILQR